MEVRWIEGHYETEEEQNARLTREAEVELERDEWRDTAQSEMAGRRSAEAEVSRLEGLILDWYENADLAALVRARTDAKPKALVAEARRIRAQRGQSKAHESDCPCVMCDPMQVRLNQQLRAQREEPLCDGSCGARPDRPHRHGGPAAARGEE